MNDTNSNQNIASGSQNNALATPIQDSEARDCILRDEASSATRFRQFEEQLVNCNVAFQVLQAQYNALQRSKERETPEVREFTGRDYKLTEYFLHDLEMKSRAEPFGYETEFSCIQYIDNRLIDTAKEWAFTLWKKTMLM